MVNRGAKRTDSEWAELVGPAGANLAVVSESRQANLRRAVTRAIRGRRGAALADEARRLAMEECEPELAIKIAHLRQQAVEQENKLKVLPDEPVGGRQSRPFDRVPIIVGFAAGVVAMFSPGARPRGGPVYIPDVGLAVWVPAGLLVLALACTIALLPRTFPGRPYRRAGVESMAFMLAVFAVFALILSILRVADTNVLDPGWVVAIAVQTVAFAAFVTIGAARVRAGKREALRRAKPAALPVSASDADIEEAALDRIIERRNRDIAAARTSMSDRRREVLLAAELEAIRLVLDGERITKEQAVAAVGEARADREL